MIKYKYRVYLESSRTIDVVFECLAPRDGELAIQAQYGNCRVVWLGRA